MMAVKVVVMGQGGDGDQSGGDGDKVMTVVKVVVMGIR